MWEYTPQGNISQVITLQNCGDAEDTAHWEACRKAHVQFPGQYKPDMVDHATLGRRTQERNKFKVFLATSSGIAEITGEPR